MDIYNLAYIYFSIGYDTDYRRMPKIDKLFSKFYLTGFLFFFLRFIGSFFKYGFCLPKRMEDDGGGFLIWGLTINNKTTLSPLITELKKKGEHIDAITDRSSFPMWKLYLYSIRYLPSLIKEIVKASKENKRIFRSRFALIWRAYGSYKLAIEMLNKYAPKFVVVASDQDPFARALVSKARENDIRTVYVQHAAVTNKFPPLDFSFSFLDGKESLSKYKQAGEIKGTIVLSGGVRFDRVLTPHKSPQNMVGVAINTIDDKKKVKELCMYLISNNIDVVFRPHPTMNKSDWKVWCKKNNVSFSDPDNEDSFQFLTGINLLVSNQSSIHLDAAIIGTKSTLYNFSNGIQNDYYGFLANDLIKESHTHEEIIMLLKDNKGVNTNVRYYNSSSQTDFFGYVSKLICIILLDLCNDITLNGRLKKIDASDNFVVYDII